MMSRLKVHMNREHSGKKMAITPPDTPTTPVEEAAELPKPEEKRVATDHRDCDELKEMALELKSHFTSKYERMMTEEKRRVNRRQSENRREMQQQLHKPPPVFLSDKNQQFIFSLLQSKHFALRQSDAQTTQTTQITQTTQTTQITQTTQTTQTTQNQKRQASQDLRSQLLELGFPASCLDACLASCATLNACIEWCCLHLKDQELPPQFRAAGKQLEVRFSGAEKRAVSERVLAFDAEIKKEALEDGLVRYATRALPSFRAASGTSLCEEVTDEIAALESIFGDEMKEETHGTLRLLSLPAVWGETHGVLVVCLSPRLDYPQQAPLVLIDAPVLTDAVKKAFTRVVFERFSGKGGGVLFEVVSDVAELMQLASKRMTQTPKPTPQAKKPSKPRESPHVAPPRVLDRALLVGKPSALVTSQRQSLPITAYKEEVLKMVESHQVSIVSGGTGCGKSTQVPQFLLERFREGAEKNLNIVVCEPRRISCLGLYNRVIEEQGFSPDRNCPVGYQVRGDAK